MSKQILTIEINGLVLVEPMLLHQHLGINILMVLEELGILVAQDRAGDGNLNMTHIALQYSYRLKVNSAFAVKAVLRLPIVVLS